MGTHTLILTAILACVRGSSNVQISKQPGRLFNAKNSVFYILRGLVYRLPVSYYVTEYMLHYSRLVSVFLLRRCNLNYNSIRHGLPLALEEPHTTQML